MGSVIDVGSTLAGYRIERIVGRGGMAVVYRAEHLHLRRPVALKVLAPELAASESFRERFIRESRIAAALEHPNVVTIYDAGEFEGALFIAMQYVAGSDLKRRLEREGLLGPERAVGVLTQVASALDAAHARGLVHRDVKPANVLTENDHCYLTDFGVSKWADASVGFTATGDFLGTPHYASPEQIEGGMLDGRTDVYALGCIAYECLVGSVPFPRNSPTAVIYAHVTAPPPRASEARPELPPAVDEVIMRALAKDPRDRFASGGGLARALREALAAPAPAAGARAEAPAAPPVTPLPPMRGGAFDAPFVGRHVELQRLRAAWGDVAAGRHRVVLLTGEPGVGKTRVARRFAQEVHERGGAVLYGRCDEDAVLPFQPWVEGIRHYLAHGGFAAQAPHLQPELQELARLVPEARRLLLDPQLPPTPDDETHRYLVFEAVATLLAEAGRRQPLLFVLDDLHWATRPTLLLLRHFLRHPSLSGVMILGSLREGRSLEASLPAFLAELEREAPVLRLGLEGLDEGETNALVAEHVDLPPTSAFVRRLRDLTDGNPFFIQETLRSLRDAPALADEHELSETVLGRLGVPERVADVVRERLSRLVPAAAGVLSAAAAIGHEFDLDVLEAVAAPSETPTIDLLEQAEAAGVVTSVPQRQDRFTFAHAIVRTALYDDLPASRRLRLHRAIGEALERLVPVRPVEPAELAHHFGLARPLTGSAREIQYCVAAAERAVELFAYEEAVGLYRRALEACARDPGCDERRRCDLLLALGRAQWQAGGGDARATYLQAAAGAREREAGEQLAAAALGLGERYWEANALDEQYHLLLEEGLRALPEDDSALRARLVARLSENLQFRGEPERAAELSAQAVAIARRLDDEDLLVTVLLARHVALLHAERLDERLELLAQVETLAGRRPALRAEAHHWRMYTLFEAGDLEAAARERDALSGLAAELRQPLLAHVARAWEGVWAQVGGELERAERLAREAHELGRRARVGDAMSVLVGQLLTLRRDQGRLPDILVEVQALARGRAAALAWRCALAFLYAEIGDRDRARERYEPMLARGPDALPRDFFWLTTTAVLAETAVLIGDAERVPLFYERLRPYAGRLVQSSFAACWGAVDRYLGLLAAAQGRLDAAVDHLDAAVALHDRLGMPLLAARARCDLADVLRATSDGAARGRAREVAAAAAAAARTRGATALVARAESGGAGRT